MVLSAAGIDYLRRFIWAMGAIPELAPKGENHVLRSTSVVQKVNSATGACSTKRSMAPRPKCFA